ncbi:MAG: dTDP-glucose 4,6-dehydratase [Candidatus Thermoplasmatota archaeon]
MKEILVTGGCGFIGSNFVEKLFQENKEIKVIVLDKLTYAGNLDNIKRFEKNKNFKFIKNDICNKNIVDKIVKNCNYVINFAAETHVDRSIIYAKDFIMTDVFGTYVLLEAARKYDIEKFIQVSTDEVYGSIDIGSFNEEDKLQPTSPYAGSKASGDLIALTYFKTYGIPIIITRSSNNFGPYQHPEKLIPLFITNAIENKPLPLYGDGMNVRDWLYVEDNCSAICLLLEKGKEGEIYNIGAKNEKTNFEITKLILKFLNKDEKLISFVRDRKAHDRRYSLDIEKIKNLGWQPKKSFGASLKKTVDWYVGNEWWWKKIKYRSDFRRYIKKQYG